MARSGALASRPAGPAKLAMATTENNSVSLDVSLNPLERTKDAAVALCADTSGDETNPETDAKTAADTIDDTIDISPKDSNSNDQKDPVDTVEASASPFDPASFPEGGARAWSVVLMSFLIQFIVVGFRDSFGVYQRYWVFSGTFPGGNNAAVSFIGTVGACGLSLFGPPSGRISDKYGYQLVSMIGGFGLMVGFILGSFGSELWHMFVSLSLFFALSFPLAYYPAIAAPGHWFLRRRGVAFGLSIAGSGLGGFAFSNLSQLMIDRVGWRWSLRITGLVGGTIVIIAGAFLKPRLPKRPHGPLVNLSYFKSRDFNRLFLLQLFASFGFYIPTYYVPAFGTNIGVPVATSSFVLAIQNICSACGRLVLPLLSDLKWTGPLNVFVVSMATLGLSVMLVLPTSTSAGQMFAFAAMWGFSSGGLTSVNTIVIANVLGTEALSEKIGHVFFSFLFGQLGGPAIAGAMVDRTTVIAPDGTRTANFWPAFIFAGVMICPLGWLFLVWLRFDKAGWKLFARV